jgi:hypothetical protein
MCELFMAPACVETSFLAADEKLAIDLYRRGRRMEQQWLKAHPTTP